MSHFGALAAATSRYAALYPNSAHGDPKSLPWYWGRMPPTHPSQLDRPSPNGKYQNYIVFKHIKPSEGFSTCKVDFFNPRYAKLVAKCKSYKYN